MVRVDIPPITMRSAEQAVATKAETRMVVAGRWLFRGVGVEELNVCGSA